MLTAAAILGLALAAISARGEPAPASAPALTLARAQELALERNADFRVAELQVAAALAQLKVAREYPNPVLGLSTSDINTDGRTNATPLGNSLLDRSYDSIVSLSQLLLVAKRSVLRDAARAGVEAAQSQRDDARRLLAQAVTQAYVAALAARDEVAVLRDSADHLRREADIAQHRLKSGDISSADEVQIEIGADQDDLNADAQAAAARAAVVALEALLGEPAPHGDTPLADSLDRLWLATPPDLETAPVGPRPDIAAAEATVAQAEANVRLQRRQRIPDVTLSVQYERQPPDQPNTAGIGISLPLPLWNQSTGEILGAKAARDQAQAQLDKVRIAAASEVTAARIAFHEAAARARRYAESLSRKSAQATRSVAYAYEHGGAALVDLLEAERNDNAIRLATKQAEADTVTATGALLAALGRGPAPSSPSPSP